MARLSQFAGVLLRFDAADTRKCLSNTVRGHVFCNFLALVLSKALQDRLEAEDRAGLERANILDDLDGLQEIELTVHDKPYRLGTEAKGTRSAVFSACGVAMPPTLQPG